MPVQGQTGVALAFTKASLRPSLPATKYTAASPTSSPTRLSQRGWVIQGPLPYSGRAAPPEWHGRNASPPSSGHGVGGLLKEPPEHRVAGIALGQAAHVARGFLPQHGAAAGVAGRLAHQCSREHPARLDAGQVALPRHATQVADAELGAPRSEADELRHKARQRAGARQAVLVDAEPQVAIDARRIRPQHAAVRVAHRLAVFGRAPGVALDVEIGRASCRERVKISVVTVAVETKGS